MNNIAEKLEAKKREQDDLAAQEQAIRNEIARLQNELNRVVTERVYLAGQMKTLEELIGQDVLGEQ